METVLSKEFREHQHIEVTLTKIRDLRYKLPRSPLDELFVEFTTLVRTSMKQIFSTRHESTYEEMARFIKRKKIDDYLKNRVIQFLEQLISAEFKGDKIPLSSFENLINEFEAILYEFQVGEKEENKQHLSDKLFGNKEYSGVHLKHLIDDVGAALEHKQYHDVEQLYIKIIQLYNLLSLKEKEELELSTQELQTLKQCRELNQQLFAGEHLDAVYAELESKEKQEEDQRRQLEEKRTKLRIEEEQLKEKEIIELNRASELFEKEKNLKRRQLRLEQRDQALMQHLALLVQKENELKALKQKIEQLVVKNNNKDQNVITTRSSLNEKEQKIEKVQDSVSEKRKEIQLLKNEIVGRGKTTTPVPPLVSGDEENLRSLIIEAKQQVSNRNKTKAQMLYTKILAQYKHLTVAEKKRLHPLLQELFFLLNMGRTKKAPAPPQEQSSQEIVRRLRRSLVDAIIEAQSKRLSRARKMYASLLISYKAAPLSARKLLFEDLAKLHKLLEKDRGRVKILQS